MDSARTAAEKLMRRRCAQVAAGRNHPAKGRRLEMMRSVVDSAIAPVNCAWCNKPIPNERRGHGSPPKTCSEQCRRARANANEKLRYEAVKSSAEWKAVRADYVRRLRRKIDADPEFRRIFNAHAAMSTAEWRKRLLQSDPARHEAMKQEKRTERAAWRERLVNDPAAWEAHKAAARAWYHSLTEDERERIYYQPRRLRQAGKSGRTE